MDGIGPGRQGELSGGTGYVRKADRPLWVEVIVCQKEVLRLTV